ncbi:aldo/keto reductase [Pseudomonas sp. LRF_L74]|uniref:aldo/keto reductase n=1 Tax=Pseudomonas sp. LRF_L74 TaxID=3369422 RepID=UPI003F617FFC
MSIATRRIGAGGPEVSALTLGSWHTYDRMPFERTVELLRQAHARGVNAFDVGMYGSTLVRPDDEDIGSFTDVLFAHAVRVAGIARERYTLSIKAWVGSVPIAEQVRRQLHRLGETRADFLILGDIYEQVDLAGLVAEVGELIGAGLFSHWGVANWSAEQLQQSWQHALRLGLPGPQTTHLRYNLFRRSVAEGEPMREVLETYGMTIHASDCLEGGVVAGRRDASRPVAYDHGQLRPRMVELLPGYEAVARRLGATPAQLGLVFCLANPHVSGVVVGVSRLEQLDENLQALDILQRIGATVVREELQRFWVDKDVVDPRASWGTRVDAVKPDYRRKGASYRVE